MTHPDDKQDSAPETEEIILLEETIDADDTANEDVIVLSEDIPPLVVQHAEQLPDISSEQIEAALEKVIRDIYGEKIERMLVDAIEEFTNSEMKRIKSAILEEDERGVRL